MLSYRFWLGCLALCEFGCKAQVDLSGFDAGAVTGGAPSAGGVNSQTLLCSNPLEFASKAIATNGYHTCALTTAGGVRCWGEYYYGQLGDDTQTNRKLPSTSDVLTGVQAIALGLDHTCALTTAGGVRDWWGPLLGL